MPEPLWAADTLYQVTAGDTAAVTLRMHELTKQLRISLSLSEATEIKELSDITLTGMTGAALLPEGTPTGEPVTAVFQVKELTRSRAEEIQALEPIHSRNIIKLQITDNHTQFGIHSKSKSF